VTWFVEEWLRRPWGEISEWSDPQLAGWHSKLYSDKNPVFGDYDELRRCTKAGKWQFSVGFADKPLYFSVLDRGDNRYRMTAISETPSPHCLGPNQLQ